VELLVQLLVLIACGWTRSGGRGCRAHAIASKNMSELYFGCSNSHGSLSRGLDPRSFGTTQVGVSSRSPEILLAARTDDMQSSVALNGA
jgi:hypothetical protein